MTGRSRLRTAIAASIATAALASCAPAGAGALMMGFSDGVFVGPNYATWLGRAAGAGSDVVRVDIGWDAVNTARRPAHFDARNPADPHYNFTTADAAVRAATADGLRVLITFTGAPRWAEGRGMPADATPGSWRPSPAALHDYGVALGRRYSGHFPDPQNPGRTLPHVWAFQPWNEPNLSLYLAPQWVGNQTAAPEMYRAMLSAFYAGVKSVDPSALVVSAGTAPFGDPQPGGLRIMPARFWRDVLCLRELGDGGLASSRCPNPVHLDALAHHPYSVGPPATKALNPDDVSIPDIGKLTRLLRAAERYGTVLPRIRHQVWVTEVGYNTSPPNPGGVPMRLDIRWVSQVLELLATQGVDLITWNNIVDQPPVPNYASTSQSGVYFLSGRPKPALYAFEFPLFAWRSGSSTIEVWGRAPVAGRLELQARTGSQWRTFRVLAVARHEVFRLAATRPGRVTVRAVVAGRQSFASTVM